MIILSSVLAVLVESLVEDLLDDFLDEEDDEDDGDDIVSVADAALPRVIVFLGGPRPSNRSSMVEP